MTTQVSRETDRTLPTSRLAADRSRPAYVLIAGHGPRRG
jgi:hypothetical protein